MINFLNLCHGNVDDVFDEIETRKPCAIFDNFSSIYFAPCKFGRKDVQGWVIAVGADNDTVPKICFRDEPTARKFYDLLVQILSNSVETYTPNAPTGELIKISHTIDVLEHGAI